MRALPPFASTSRRRPGYCTRGCDCSRSRPRPWHSAVRTAATRLVRHDPTDTKKHACCCQARAGVPQCKKACKTELKSTSPRGPARASCVEAVQQEPRIACAVWLAVNSNTSPLNALQARVLPGQSRTVSLSRLTPPKSDFKKVEAELSEPANSSKLSTCCIFACTSSRSYGKASSLGAQKGCRQVVFICPA